MKTRKRRREATILRTALRGAAAGAIGGLIVSLAEREVVSRLAGAARHRAGWDRTARRGLAHAGVAVDGTSEIVAGLASQILYGAALGAVYGILQERTSDSRAGVILLDATLTYAASLVFGDRPAAPHRAHRHALRCKVAQRHNPAASFSRATGMAFGALSR